MIRINWHHETGNGHVGRIGGMVLFTVHRSSGSERRPFLLESTLPITVPADMRNASSQGAAEVDAEILLDRFLRDLGVEWKGR